MIYKKGSYGSEVMYLQKTLGVVDDGFFGPKTEAAVMAFQKAHGLMADGVVGPITWAVLFPAVHPPSPQPTKQIRGIDIAHYDTVRDWTKLVPSGWLFAFIKATEGLSLVDDHFKSHWTNAKSNGILRGAYHFMRMNLDPKKQAEFFVNTVKSNGDFLDTDLPFVCDWEYANGDPSPGDDKIVKIFLETVHKLTNRIPIVYVGYFVVEALNNPAWLKEYPLWMPWYASVDKIKTPSPWGHWTFWQDSGDTQVPGIGSCDTNFYNGSLEDLKVFIKNSK